MSAGKGDTPRKVDKNKYDKNFDEIDWSKHKKTEEVKVKKP